jgi:hypothetical protein
MMKAGDGDLPARATASSSEPVSPTAGCGGVASVELTTMFCRPGSGLPIDAYVFRPMMTAWPSVSCLKCFRSSGRRHGSCPPRPITRLAAIATTR